MRPGGMMRLIRALLLALAAFAALPATASAATGLLTELDTSSPAATMQSFQAEKLRLEALYDAFRTTPTTATQLALARGLQRVGAHLFDLQEVPPAARRKAGNAAVGYLADILNRLPPIAPETIPGGTGRAGTELPPRWTIPGTEIRIVRLAGGPRAGDYVFSAATVARLPEFHAQIIAQPPLGPTPVADWSIVQHRAVGAWLAGLPLASLPETLHVTLLGTPAWKVIVALLTAAAILAIVMRWARLVRRWAARATPWRRHALWLTVPVLLALLVVLGHGFMLLEVILSDEIAEAEIILARIALYLAAAWAAWCLCWLLAELAIASSAFPGSSYDAHMLRTVARVGSLLSAAGILIYGANDIGVPALGLLAGVSIGGIALALAAQSTAENLLGGVAIFADRPFHVGDQIRYGDNSGTVEAVGPRSTRIRGADDTLTTVPNADLAKTQLTNISARSSCLFQHRITLTGGLSSTQLEALLAELRRRVAAHPLAETGPGLPRVRLVGFGASAKEIEIEIFARIRTTVSAEFLEVQEALILDILRAVETHGADLAGQEAAIPPSQAAN